MYQVNNLSESKISNKCEIAAWNYRFVINPLYIMRLDRIRYDNLKIKTNKIGNYTLFRKIQNYLIVHNHHFSYALRKRFYTNEMLMHNGNNVNIVLTWNIIKTELLAVLF